MLPSVNNHLPIRKPPVGFSPNGELSIWKYHRSLFRRDLESKFICGGGSCEFAAEDKFAADKWYRILMSGVSAFSSWL
jgi:hypothetical protein